MTKAKAKPVAVDERQMTLRGFVRDFEAPAPLAVIDAHGVSNAPALTYLSELRPGASRETMRWALQKLLRTMRVPNPDIMTFPWWTFTRAHTSLLRGELQKTAKKASTNTYLSALRGVLRASADLGLMTHEACLAALRGAKSVKGRDPPPGRVLTTEEICALMDQCNPETAIGARDRAMLQLLYASGLRRAGLVGLPITCERRKDGSTEFLALEKFGKKRKVYFTKKEMKEIDRWLAIRGDFPGPILCPVRNDGAVQKRRYSPKSVYTRLQVLAAGAGLGVRITPHDFRRTFITDLLELDVPIERVSKLVGHENLQTTSSYDRRGEKANEEARLKVDRSIG